MAWSDPTPPGSSIGGDDEHEMSPEVSGSKKPLLVSIWNCYDVIGVPPNVFRAWAKRGCFRVFDDNHGRWPVAVYDEVKDFIERNLQSRSGPKRATLKEDEDAIIRQFSTNKR